MQSFTTVPFSTESSHGLRTFHGMAKFSHVGIVFEFESKLFGVITDGIKEVRLPIAEILDIKFRKGVFKRFAKIEVRTRTLAKIAELPLSEGKLVLKLTRDDFERGRDAVLQLQRDIQFSAAEPQQPRSPVSQLFTDDLEEDTRELRE